MNPLSPGSATTTAIRSSVKATILSLTILSLTATRAIPSSVDATAIARARLRIVARAGTETSLPTEIWVWTAWSACALGTVASPQPSAPPITYAGFGEQTCPCPRPRDGAARPHDIPGIPGRLPCDPGRHPPASPEPIHAARVIGLPGMLCGLWTPTPGVHCAAPQRGSSTYPACLSAFLVGPSTYPARLWTSFTARSPSLRSPR
jgi:hypothetical protein